MLTSDVLTAKPKGELDGHRLHSDKDLMQMHTWYFTHVECSLSRKNQTGFVTLFDGVEGRLLLKLSNQESLRTFSDGPTQSLIEYKILNSWFLCEIIAAIMAVVTTKFCLSTNVSTTSDQCFRVEDSKFIRLTFTPVVVIVVTFCNF